MLQQTTVSTVINHFERFIQKYPSITDLAKATEEQILMDWKGLGYYRRARNLLNAAKEIQENFSGDIPLNYGDLVSIKGIGAYTANAIIGIGADQRALCLDANLERVISRLYALKTHKGPRLQKEIYQKFMEYKICEDIDKVGPRKFNEALMDLGRSVCKAKNAHCHLCPLRENCLARLNSNPLFFPNTQEQKKTQQHELFLLRVVVQKANKILVYQKHSKEWLSGQYELPSFNFYSTDLAINQYAKVRNDEAYLFLPQFKTAITKYKITNFVLYADEFDFDFLKNKRFEWKKLEDLNLSTASLKALHLI
jgi:A/G-specific adenine glycosylase